MDALEPGLLPAFRLFVGFQILTLVIALTIMSTVRPELNLRTFALSSLSWMVLLLAYLSWSRLQQVLGSSYLPIALFLASAAPIAQRISFFYAQGQDSLPFTDVEIASSGWRLLVVLLVPLVLIAWQYNFRAVLCFSLGTFLLNLVLASWLLGINHSRWAEIIELSLSGAIVFGLIGYIVTKLVNQQREKQQALAETNAKLVDYAATVEQLAISQERNRLARDLHDTLAHTLSAVSVQLEAVDSAWDHSPQQARDLLHKSLANARSGLGETRRALRALRAAPLEDLGLFLALRTLAETTAKRQGLQLDVRVPDLLNLPTEIEQNIYRIAQEALANVVRHAKASQLSVHLEQSSDLIVLTIGDNGRGFVRSEEPSSGHFGLRGMQERAELMDAQLEIESTPGMGSTVRLTIGNQQGGQL